MTKKKFYSFLFENKVVFLFVLLCIGGIVASGQPMTFVANELFTRIARNSFLILALIIPVLAGMGLNFGIVIGAIAAQIALFLTTHWGFVGIEGFIITAVVATPMAVFFGYLVGRLFNKMKGAEMIGGLVLGYFADGLYQLLFLFIFGGVIAINNPTLMISTGVGVKNTIDLKDTIKYSLDTVSMLSIVELVFIVIMTVVGLYAVGKLLKFLYSVVCKMMKKQDIDFKSECGVFAVDGWKKKGAFLLAVVACYALSFIPVIESFLAVDRLLLLTAIEVCVFGTIIYQALKLLMGKLTKKENFNYKKPVARMIMAAIVYVLTFVPAIYTVLIYVKLPVTTFLCIAALCAFNTALMKTRLGQNIRTVGQNRVVANAAGINVDRTRIMAMILSTVLASWGQLIFLQSIGTFSTYGAHLQVGQFAIAALLVGGASVQKATNKQAIVGVILFHTLFIVAPLAGQQLLGNAMIGEYFRVFVSYGVIALSLAMHAWKSKPKAQSKNTKPLPTRG